MEGEAALKARNGGKRRRGPWRQGPASGKKEIEKGLEVNPRIVQH